MPFIPEDTNGCKQSTGLLMCPCVPSMRPIASNISIKQLRHAPLCVTASLWYYNDTVTYQTHPLCSQQFHDTKKVTHLLIPYR